MIYQLWFEVCQADDHDKKNDLGFAHSAEFTDPDEAAEFASALHEFAQLWQRTLKGMVKR